MSVQGVFPAPPKFTANQVEACHKSGDYRSILFEWYKYTGHITNLIASIDLASPAIKKVSVPQYGALIGLLNRCCRLMLANVALSHEGFFGETTALIDRCIFESSVKVLWLCEQNSSDAFDRYFAEGLKTELALKAEIKANISARDNQVLQIEERMLKSIERYLGTSGMTDGEIAASKKLPDLASMIEGLGHERLAYVVGQKIGSHHVHGTWPSLLLHYLEWDDGSSFKLRDHDCQTHVNQYVLIPLMVLSAAKAFCEWLMTPEDAESFNAMLQSIEDEIFAINKDVIGSDFKATEET